MKYGARNRFPFPQSSVGITTFDKMVDANPQMQRRPLSVINQLALGRSFPLTQMHAERKTHSWKEWHNAAVEVIKGKSGVSFVLLRWLRAVHGSPSEGLSERKPQLFGGKNAGTASMRNTGRWRGDTQQQTLDHNPEEIHKRQQHPSESGFFFSQGPTLINTPVRKPRTDGPNAPLLPNYLTATNNKIKRQSQSNAPRQILSK